MSQSNLQLLLHAGELEYIVNTIKKSKQTEFVGGCLFGLWRNSLKQPVIQFVTGSGPDKKFDRHSTVRDVFENQYAKTYAGILKNDHRLLHLGFWFYGSEDKQEEAKRVVFGSREPKCEVLLFINSKDPNDAEKWTGEYHLRKDDVKASSPLYKEDVLDGHSSFRLYGPLTEQIKESKVSPKPTSNFVKLKFGYLQSRVQVEEAVTSGEQWYSSDDGMVYLQLLFQYFQGEGIAPEMSRDTGTQDMQFGFSGGYCLDFPANFPREMPTIRAPDGSRYDLDHESNRDEDVCQTVVRTVVKFLRNPPQPSSRGGRRTGGGRGYNH